MSRLLLASAAAWAACTGSPTPAAGDELTIELPDRWTAAPGAPTEDRALRVDWWREFDDPRLDALVAQGLESSPNLQAAVARLEAAAAAQAIAGAPLLPALDASFNADRARRLFLGFPFGSGSGVPSTTISQYGLSVSVRWELDVWGRLRSTDAAALADQQAAIHDLEGAQLSLAAQICRAWYAAAEARQQLTLAESTARALEETLADVRDRFRRGVRPALEVHQAANNLANAQASIAQRRELLLAARRRLDVLVGRYPAGDGALADALPDQLPQVPAGLPSALLQRRPDLRAAERRVAAAGCRVDAAEAALYPKLALTGSGGTQSLELEELADTGFRVWGLGANLLQPLFQGGALRAEVRRNEAARAEALAGYRDAVLRAFGEVEDILAADGQLQERLTALTSAASHATQARDLARERWQFGLTDFLAVADGQRQAFQAESARLTVTRQRIDNRIDLLLALGGGLADEGAPEPR